MAFFAASCQQEMLDPAAQESTVTYTVELPGVQTKAGATDYKFGSGLNTDELIYEVWKTENGNETNLTGTNAVRLYQETVGLHVIDGVRKTTISLNLVQDQEYTILFWAQVKDADVYNTENLTKVQYKYNPAEANYDVNREDMAAFYAVDFVSDGDPKAKKVVLKRPFAQLNIATEITTEEYKITLDKAEVVVDNVPSAFNVATKTSYAEERTRFVFKNAAVPQEPNKTITVNNHTYNYVAMNYMFATNGGQTATVKYSIDATLTSRKLNGEISGETTKATVTNDVQNVPLQENYRTNIVGNLITSTTDYEVVIDASWDDVNDPDLNGDGYLVEVWDKKYTQEPPMVNGAYEISLASELAWVAAVANGNIVATKSATIDPRFKNVTVKLIEDIDLAGALWNPIKDFDGTFDGNGKTIKNLTVKAEGMAPAALFAHAHRVKNLTVANADIKGHYKTAVIVANAMGGGIVIENCAVVNSTVEATPINKDEANNVGAIVGYLSAENDACVKNCVVKDVTIKAFRKVGTIAGVANCAAVVKDNVMDNVTIIADQTVPYVKNNYDGNAGPVVGWAAAEATVTGNTVGDNVVVKRYVDSTEELEYAVADAQNGETIYVGGEVTMPSFKNKSLKFVGLEGKGLVNMPKTHVTIPDFEGSSLYFENIKLYAPNYGGDTTTHGYVGAIAETYKSCTFENYYTFYSNVTNVTDCVFNGVDGQYFWTGNSNEITFTNCKFIGVDRAVNVCSNVKGESHVVTFDGCEFSATIENKAALEISGDYGPYTINVNNCEVKGFKVGENTGEKLFNIKNTPDNVTIIVDGSEWKGNGLFEDENGNKTVTSTEGLITALSTSPDQVTVKAGTYTFPASSIKNDVEINCEEGTVFTGTSGLNINGATVIGATFENKGGMAATGTIYGTFKECTFDGSEALRWCYSNDGKAVVFEDCVIKTDFRGFHFDDMKGDVIFRGCQINGFNAYGGEGTATFENCVFGNDESSYNGLNIYSNTVLTGCQFNFISGKTNFIDMEGIGKTLTITNCTATLDGVAKPVTDFVGGSKIDQNTVILDHKVYVSNAAQLTAAVDNGATDIVLAGEFEMPSHNTDKTITFTSLNGTAVIDNTKGSYWENATLTFNNVNFKTGTGYVNGNGADYAALYSKNVTYNQCKFNGPMRLGRDGAKFNACTFNGLGNDYVWTYGKSASFNGCTFNSEGKAILIYSDGPTPENGAAPAVSVINCTFNATKGAKAGAIANQNCAAVEIDNYGNGVTLTTSGNTVDEDFSGVWRIKTYYNRFSESKIFVNGTEYTTIALDGKTMTIDASKNVTVLE